MSFPNSFDDDTTLPFVNDNITEIGGIAINALRDAVYAMQQNIGLNAQGSTASISERFGVSFYPDGQLKSSAITSLGLVTLPITEDQIADWAAIPERKLQLDHRTADLFNYIRDLSGDVNIALGWIQSTGVKLSPHLVGQIYRHELDHITVSTSASDYLLNNLRLVRDNSNAYSLVDDMNNELLAHQWADGSPMQTINNIITNNGSIYPSNYAHTASGIFLNTSRFSTIPQTANDLQSMAEFIDSTSIFLLGTRLQNLYSNGISRESRSSVLGTDGYGQGIVPSTPAIAYLKNIGNSSYPFDDINTGDDIIEFVPSADLVANHTFDAKFALVKVGDIVRVNYGTVELPFVIKEKKYVQSGGNKKYVVRIAGKNIEYQPNASARIDKPLVNLNKYGVLALAAANNGVPTVPASVITVNPRGGQTLGLGFNADQFDSTHYMLYLALYPTGNPVDGYVILPGIDVTGNQGTKPGTYSLQSIITATNNAFRTPGYNYRFVAFEYNGEFGIALADSYNNTGFSILSAVVTSAGALDEVGSDVAFPNNVVGMFSAANTVAPDPLGLGPSGSNVASPPYQTTYGSAAQSQGPTKIFIPLRRNNYYVNGTEREKLNLDVDQVLDTYGDGYWPSTIIAQDIIPGSPGNVQTTYRIPLDLSASQLKKGKTIVVQSLDGYGTFPNDFGRFVISDISFGCCTPSSYTDIKVIDAVHGLAVSGNSGLAMDVGSEAAIYFSSDSISFNAESATDFTSVSPFKRHFEVYIDENGNTFSHERGRFNIGNISPLLVNDNIPLVNYSELIKLNIIKISPKLRGYQFGSVNKITFHVSDFNSTTGAFDGYLSSWDGNLSNPPTNYGPVTSSKVGLVTRLYDETYVDYIDIIFDIATTVSSFTSQHLDIQLFPTLSLDNQIMKLGTFQYNDVTNVVDYVQDERQFGNISEKDLSTSALNLMALPERLLHGNGIIRGFELENKNAISNPNGGQIYLTGGEVLVNGKFFQLNNDTVIIPASRDITPGNMATYKINWLICVNQLGELQILPLADSDSALSISGSANKICKINNLVSGQSYNIEATTFSNVVNKRKDLTMLYIASSTSAPGSPPTVSVVMNDVRKFINDGDTLSPLKFTSSTAQGNFHSIIPIFNWIKFNNAFNGNVIVKGANASNATITTTVELHFTSGNVTIDGQNAAEITFDAAVTLGSNLTVKNLTMNFNAGVATKANTSVTNLIFENCVLNVTIPSSGGNVTTIFNFNNANNIQFKDCTINVTWEKNLPLSSYDVLSSWPSVIKTTNTTNFVFDNSSMIVDYANTTPGSIPPGGCIILVSTDNAIIDESDFSGNINRAIYVYESDNLKITNSTFTSTYNPVQDAFDADNLVSSASGSIYCNVLTTVDNIIIDNVHFNYVPEGDPDADTDLAIRYPFVSFELSTLSSTLKNLKVTNCKFNHLNLGDLVDDVRPAISIVNTYSLLGSPTTAANQQPIVMNANISNNNCNANQSIIITSRRDTDSIMNYPGLATQGVTVRENVCGNIGYLVATAHKTANLSPSHTSLPDKLSSLTIDNNLCHYIYCCDEEGINHLMSKVIDGYTENQIAYPSGYVTISNNRTNWIHVGIAYEENSGLSINGNFIQAYSESYINTFGDNTDNCIGNIITKSYRYAIFVGGTRYLQTATQSPSENIDCSVNITNNVTNFGYWYQTSGTAVNYGWTNGYILVQPSSIIKDNKLKGINGLLGGSNLVQVGGKYNLIQGNMIYRGDIDIVSYIRFDAFGTPSWDDDPGGEGFGSKGMIIDNFMDQDLPNVAVTPIFTGNSYLRNIIIPSTAAPGWVVERNINHICAAIIPWTNGHILYSMSGGSGYGPDGYTTLGMRPAQDIPGGTFTGTYRSKVLRFTDTAPAGSRIWGAQINLEQFLPPNVKILTIESAIRSFGSQVDYDPTETPSAAATSNFWINLSSHDMENVGVGVDELDLFASASDDDAGIYETTTPVYSKVSGGAFNATSAAIPFSIDLTNYGGDDISTRYITGRAIGITLSLDARWARDGNVDFVIAPILVTYKW